MSVCVALGGGKTYVRVYTPISEDSNQGIVDFVIKVYGPSRGFPEGGHLSQILDVLEIGDTVDVRGPLGSFSYRGGGDWEFGTLSGRARRIVMIAGGTGITPMYQMLRAIAQDPEDDTEVRLIYANSTMDDILLKDKLDHLKTKDNQGRIRIW